MSVVLIRRAEPEDLPDICAIYQRARQFMRETGNPTQWGNVYPSRELAAEDIQKRQSYVCTIDGRTEGAFVLQPGEDPAYAHLVEGTWASTAPYHTIHRIASSGRVRGIFPICIRWCHENYGSLRIDTHPQNLIMQRLIPRAGFRQSGLIQKTDGSYRLVYELI